MNYSIRVESYEIVKLTINDDPKQSDWAIYILRHGVWSYSSGVAVSNGKIWPPTLTDEDIILAQLGQDPREDI